jgi:heme oxygenase (biliverdin-IX-beta and delta-forming)
MLLSRLKIETREAHERIERDLDLMSERLTLRRYGAVLTRFHAFLCAWEPRIAAVLEDEAFLGPRRKLPLIEADLAALGLPATRQDVIPLSFIRDRASAMGSLYVLEGSTLGGQHIVRHVQRVLGLSGPGTLFFGSYGREVGRRWHAFRSVLEACSDGAVDDVIVASANATFRCLGQVLIGVAAAPARLEAAGHV